MERDKGRAVRVSRSSAGEQRRAAVLGSRGGSAEDAFKHYILRHVQGLPAEVIARRQQHDGSPRTRCRFHGRYYRPSVVRLAVACGAEIPHV